MFNKTRKSFFISAVIIFIVAALGVFTASFAANHQLSLKLSFPSSPDWDGYEFWWGGRYAIQWTADGISVVDINLLKSGNLYKVLGTNIAVDAGGGITSWGNISGRFEWIVPQDITPGNDYAVEILEHVSIGQMPRVKDRSGLLAFTQKATIPTLSVISPNGGKKVQSGEKYEIRWNSNMIGNPRERVFIYLLSKKCVEEGCLKAGASYTVKWPDVMMVALNAPNTGSYSWDVPKLNTQYAPRKIIRGPEVSDGMPGYSECIDPREYNASPGQYKVRVVREYEAASGRIHDDGDGFFTLADDRQTSANFVLGEVAVVFKETAMKKDAEMLVGRFCYLVKQDLWDISRGFVVSVPIGAEKEAIEAFRRNDSLVKVADYNSIQRHSPRDESTNPPTPQQLKTQEAVLNSLTEDRVIDSVEKIVQTKTSEETPIYEVSARKRARLLFIIPVTMKLRILVHAENGSVLSIDKPWWAFLAR